MPPNTFKNWLIETNFRFGQWKGHDITHADSQYLIWLLQNSVRLTPQERSEIEHVLDKRGVARPEDKNQAKTDAWLQGTIINTNRYNLQPGTVVKILKRKDGTWYFSTTGNVRITGVIPDDEIENVVKTS